MVGHGGSSADSYPADPTSHISSHCAVTILLCPAICTWLSERVTVNQASAKLLQQLLEQYARITQNNGSQQKTK